MAFHQAQKIIVKDNHRFRVLRCGRRFGKTVLAAKEIKGKAISRPQRIVYVANNYQQARDIAWELFKRELKGAIIDTNEARLEIRTNTQKGDESIVFLRGWESVENLRGQAFDFLVVDEVASMDKFWLRWREVLRPTLTDRKGEALFASTPKGFNHFYDLCNQELVDKDFKTFHFTSWDNPFLPREELERARDTLPKEVYLQEYEASFEKTSGLVFKEFNREKHLYEELPEGNYEKLAGVDFGYVHPAAVPEIRWNGEKLYIEDEWYKTGRTDAQIAEYVASCKFKAVYPDPENAGGIEELRRRDVNVREVKKGKGSIIEGIQMMRELFLNGQLLINKRCVNLIAELESYAYPEDSDKEIPLKENDDAIDAVRYVVLSLFHKMDKQKRILREIGKRKWEMSTKTTNPV